MLAGFAAGTVASFSFFAPTYAAQVPSMTYQAHGGWTVKPFLYLVGPEVTLPFLAQKYGTSIQNIRSVNGLHSSVLYLDQELLIPEGSALVNGAAQTLAAEGPPGTPAAVSTPDPGAIPPESASSSTPATSPVPAPATSPVPAPEPQSFIATAYDSSAGSNGPWGAVDYFGLPLRFGDVAVDPKVIPLGTRLWITGYSDPALPRGGFYARAVDEGGAIQGNRIDIYLPTPSQAMQFGVETVRVLRAGN